VNSRFKTLSHIQSQVDIGDMPDVCRARVLYCKAVVYQDSVTQNRLTEGKKEEGKGK
jgi:hypothetical protein